YVKNRDFAQLLDHGRKIAQGISEELKALVGGERIEISLATDADVTPAHRVLARFSEGEVRVENRTLTAPVVGGATTLTRALRALDDERPTVCDVGLRRPTLDDVFLTLTGRTVEPAVGEAGAPAEAATDNADSVRAREAA
ncbi:MAG: daunorubicin/doxorubicin resistance ABC transporter ATP-binding protein DrrA, partial [Acidimicrobiales bacterium]